MNKHAHVFIVLLLLLFLVACERNKEQRRRIKQDMHSSPPPFPRKFKNINIKKLTVRNSRDLLKSGGCFFFFFPFSPVGVTRIDVA